MSETGPEQPPAARRPWRMPLLIVGPMIIGVALILVFGIWLAQFRYGGQSRLDKAIAEIEEAGYPTTLQALNEWYPDVPEAQNAAVPLQAAFDAYKPPRAAHTAVPFFRSEDWSASELNEQTLSDAKALLEENAECLKHLREALARDDARFPVDFVEAPNVSQPHLARLRAVQKILALDALVRAREGDADAAARALEQLFALPDVLAQEPSLLSQMVRASMWRTALDALEAVLNAGQLTQGHLESLRAAILDVESSEWLHKGLIGERALYIALSKKQQQTGEGGAIGRLLGLGGRFAYFYLQVLNRAVELAAEPAGERSDALERMLEAAKGEGWVESYYIDAASIPPTYARMFQTADELDAKLRVARTVLGVEEYRIAEDSIPPNFAAAADYMDELPEDPFTGEVIRYTQTANGYTVYSIGPDRSDNTAGAGAGDLTADNTDIAMTIAR